jgi:hypothetical protein
MQPARRIGRPTSIGVLVGRATRPVLGRRGLGGAEVLAHWPAIVGGDLSVHAAPVRVKFPRGRNDQGTLVLRVAHGAAATLIHLKTLTVLERVNRFFGYTAVARVEISQGPLPTVPFVGRENPPKALGSETEAEIERDVAAVGPPELKLALKRLGEAVRRRTG